LKLAALDLLPQSIKYLQGEKMNKLTYLIVLVLTAQICNATIINVPSEQASIQAGIDAASTGDTVLVANGIYVENITFNGKMILLSSLNGADVTIIAAANPAIGVVSFTTAESKGTTISGFSITGSNIAGIYCNGSSPTIINNHIYNNQSPGENNGAGIDLNNTIGSYIYGNEINNNIAAGYGGAIHLEYCLNDTICYNTIYGNQGAGDIRSLVSIISIYNNTINSSFIGIYNQNGGTRDVRNNIIINASYGIYAAANDPTLAEYNCFWQCGTNYNEYVTGGSGNITDDPVFVDESLHIYFLQSTSPCIDAGDPDIIFNDEDGTRNDIGVNPYINYPIPDNINFGESSNGDTIYSITPYIYWTYSDIFQTTQSAYEIEVGTDNEWSEAEMWSSGQVSSPDTTALYTGLTLTNHEHNYLRIRVSNGRAWGAWMEKEFIVRSSFLIGVPADQPTIQQGIDFAWDGDTVLVAPDTYYEHINFDGKSIVVKSSDGPETTIIEKLVDGLSIVTFNSGENNNSILNGFIIQNGDQGNGGGIRIENSSPMIINNIIRNNGTSGITCWNGSSIGSVIENNLISDNSTYDIHCYYSPMKIINNTITYSYDVNSHVYIYGSDTDTVLVKNNIIAYANGYGIHLQPGSNALSYYNDVFGNATADYYGLMPGMGCFSEDPLFCDTTTQDFTLASTSPCIGTGEGGANIGAFGVGCDAPSPEMPEVTNLSIENIGDSLHITNHIPTFMWQYFDEQDRPHIKSEIEVGIDDEWTIAEMWQPSTIESDDTSIVYDGDPLLDGDTYYVRVRVRNDTLWGNWLTASFRMNSVPFAPLLFSPDSGVVVSTGKPTLITNNTSDLEGGELRYNFEIYYDSNLTQLAAYAFNIIEGSSQTSWTSDSLTDENGDYWWRARASDGYENGLWSDTWMFILNAYNDPPNPFDLISPEQEEAISDLSPTFTWDAAIDPDPDFDLTYTLYIGLDSLFNFFSQIPDIPSSTHTLASELTAGSPFWWKVKVEDEFGDSALCNSVFKFWTVICGDANNDKTVNVSDAVYIVNYVFIGGGPPIPIESGDPNCDGECNISDAVWIINYVFLGGNEPCDTDGDTVPDC
jgi:Periplasmic copper-binding protein (NosD)/Dockerin type I domain/Right handed beta helix region